MRSPYICLIVLAVAVILIAQPVAALPILQVPYVRAGPVWSLSPSEIADLVIFETNTSHLAASDSEALAVSFVPTAHRSSGRISHLASHRPDVEPGTGLRPIVLLP